MRRRSARSSPATCAAAPAMPGSSRRSSSRGSAWMLELRPFIQGLEAEGDLVRIRDKVSTQYDIVALTRQSSDQGGPALLFENVEGSEFPVLSGLFGTQRRVAKALGLGEQEL